MNVKHGELVAILSISGSGVDLSLKGMVQMAPFCLLRIALPLFEAS